MGKKKLSFGRGLIKVLVCLVALGILIGPGIVFAEKKPILIGVSAAMTGFVVPYDMSGLEGLKLFIEEKNAAGGVLGRKLELKVTDTKSSVDNAATTAIDLINQGVELLVTTCDFDLSAGAINVATGKKMLAVSFCAGSERYLKASPTAFSMGTTGQTESSGMAEFAYHKLGIRKVATVLDDIYAISRAWLGGFEGRFKELAGEDAVVRRETFLNPDPSVAAQVSAIKKVANKIDAVYISTFPPGGVAFMRQLRAAGIQKTILTPNMSGTFWLPSIPTLSNYYFTDLVVPIGDPNPRVRDLFKQYTKRTGKEQPGCLACYIEGYVLGQAIAKAIEKTGGSTDGMKLAAAFETFTPKDKEFVINVDFGPERHISVKREVRVRKIENGKVSVVGAYLPEKICGL